MNRHDFPQTLQRQIGMFTPEEQARIRNLRVAVCGLGGTGSVSAVLLAKMGVGKLLCIDKDQYEAFNVVEQLGASKSTLGQDKSAVVAALCRDHGPETDVSALTLDIQSFDEILAIFSEHEIGLVVSSVDDPVCRVLLNRAAAARAVPVMNAANIGWKTYNSFNFPGGITYEEQTWMPSRGSEITPQIAAMIRIQQKYYIATIAGFDADYVAEYLAGRVDYISYAGPPAFFAASQAMAQVARWAAGRLPARQEPYIFCVDLETGKEWDTLGHAIVCGEVMRAAATEGPAAGLRTWKELNSNLQQLKSAAMAS